VANTLKYLNGQPVVGVNPDPVRWDGRLLPFQVRDLPKLVPEVLFRKRRIRSVTMAKATLNNGQVLYGVNDLFIGPKTHTSARYVIRCGEANETQSSSGVIVSTGMGSTGWLKSLLTGAAAISASAGSLMPRQKTEDVLAAVTMPTGNGKTNVRFSVQTDCLGRELPVLHRAGTVPHAHHRRLARVRTRHGGHAAGSAIAHG